MGWRRELCLEKVGKLEFGVGSSCLGAVRCVSRPICYRVTCAVRSRFRCGKLALQARSETDNLPLAALLDTASKARWNVGFAIFC